ncbi:MAG: AraC family transcriptional regulator [Desulfobacterales bacterium]|nr:AraC family transcriptional regulator [Desulfobacterales bacterium]
MEQNKVTYYRDKRLDGIEACRVERSTHNFPSHSHDNIYTLGYMESGCCFCQGRMRKNSYLEAGEFALINPTQVHAGGPDGSPTISYRMFYIDIDLLKKISTDSSIGKNGFPEFKKIVAKDHLLANKFDALFEVMHNKCGLLEKESALIEALGFLTEQYGFENVKSFKIGKENNAVEKAKSFLSEELDLKMPLTDVADVAGFSKYHFLRVFKKNTGISPHAFRTQQRIEYAKKLIKQGIAFSQVALETGFTDQSHFTKKFRQFTAASPGQYL